MRPRFTSFTSSRTVQTNPLAPKALDDNSLSRPSELRRSTTAYPRETSNWSFGNGYTPTGGALKRANSSNTSGSNRRQVAYDQDRIVTPVTPSRFSSHFGLRTGGVSYPETLDGSSNSFPEEDEDDDSDDLEWGLERGMSLFEVSAKDDTGMSFFLRNDV